MNDNPTEQPAISPWVGYAMLVAVVFFWSTGIVWVRWIHETIPPLGMSFWRWFGGALVVLPFAWPKLREEFPIIRKRLPFFFMMGMFIVGGSTLSTLSLNFTTATNGGILNATQPTMTALVAWAFFQDKLSLRQASGILGAFLGITLMTSKGDVDVLTSLAFNAGDMIMICAVVGYAWYANFLPRLPKDVSFSSALFVIMFCGGIELIPLYAIESIVAKPVPMLTETVVTVIFLAIVPTVLPTILWNKAVPAVGVNKSAIFVNLMPVFSAGMAILFLGEELYFYHVAGALMIFLGILLVVSQKKPPPADD